MISTFFIAFTISFLGSIPVGVLNLTIIDIGLRKPFSQVFLFALACALIEYGQGFVALKFSSLFNSNPNLEVYIDIIAIPVFFVLGIIYLRKHGKSLSLKNEISDFKKGLLLSIVNPLAIPFWVLWATIANNKGWLIMDNFNIAIFTLGISTGTFLTLILYGIAANKIIHKLTFVNKQINRIIGWILIILGIIQVVKTFLNW